MRAGRTFRAGFLAAIAAGTGFALFPAASRADGSASPQFDPLVANPSGGIAYYTPRSFAAPFGGSLLLDQVDGSAGPAGATGFGITGVGMSGGGSDSEPVTLNARAGFGSFLVTGSYAARTSMGARETLSWDAGSWDAGVGYAAGPWTSLLSYEARENSFLVSGPEGAQGDLIQMGIAYNPLPGLTLGASLGFSPEEADLGGPNPGQDERVSLFTTGIVIAF